MTSLVDQEQAVQDFMSVLNEHRKNCERLGRYVEAEIARKRLDELRQHEESRMREALRARQLAEMLAIEEAHMMEFQQFNALQDAKMAAFEMNAQALMDALRARHADELRDFQQRLLARAGGVRHSREYMTLRDVQGKLASGKNYAGAAKIKEKADELMAYEEDKWQNERQVEMLNKEKVFKTKLTQEAEALKKRISSGRGEANRNRQVELERLLQRYNNVKAEMEQRHKLERQKLDKEIALEAKQANKMSSSFVGVAGRRAAAAGSAIIASGGRNHGAGHTASNSSSRVASAYGGGGGNGFSSRSQISAGYGGGDHGASSSAIVPYGGGYRNR